MRDIASLFQSDREPAPPARPVAEGGVGPDWHRRQIAKLAGLLRFLDRLDGVLSPPLETILLHAPLALQTIPLGTPGREHVPPLRHAAESLRALQHALRDLRVATGADDATVDITAAVRRVLQLFPTIAGEGPIRLEVVYPSESAKAHGRAEAVDMALFHLVRNAVEAMQAAGGTLRLRIAVDGGEVAVTVQDSGAGMDPHVLEQVAEPLMTTKGESGHIGMGLTMALALVDAMGGTLAAASTLGKGTSFSITLRRVV